MTTTISLSRTPISPANLQHLLSADGLVYESLGGGVREALECLDHAEDFYALPEALQPRLTTYRQLLLQALDVLEQTRRQSEA